MRSNVFLVITLLFFTSFSAFSQCENNPLLINSLADPIVCAETLPYDSAQVSRKHKELYDSKGIKAVGEVIKTDFHFPKYGAFLPRLSSDEYFSYAMKIRVEEAEYLSLRLSEINLAEGEKISVYGKAFDKIELDKNQLGSSKNIVIPALRSNQLRIAFNTPNREEISTIPFKISEVRVMSQGYDNSRGGDCNIDANCSEGDGWNEQRDAVVKLIISEGGTLVSCTGTLMNNTALDGRRLVLSALHCMSNVTEAEFNSAVVIFNNENSYCNANDANELHMLSGLTKLADSNDFEDGEPNPNGSDFILLEIQDEIPEEWHPFWAGWNSINQASSSGVCIHHPSGEEKKVSSYSTNTVSTFVGAPGSHWGVTWQETENGHGVTEPGSSGSALFNSQGQVIGTLTGGFSSCIQGENTGPNESDFFGKLSYHWLNNPNSATQKLKVWLDPLDFWHH